VIPVEALGIEGKKLRQMRGGSHPWVLRH